MVYTKKYIGNNFLGFALTVFLVSACGPAPVPNPGDWERQPASQPRELPEVRSVSVDVCDQTLVFVTDHGVHSAYRTDLTDPTRPALEPLADGAYDDGTCKFQIRYQQYYCPGGAWSGC